MNERFNGREERAGDLDTGSDISLRGLGVSSNLRFRREWRDVTQKVAEVTWTRGMEEEEEKKGKKETA